MQFAKLQSIRSAPDLTPMIGITFLVAIFLLLVLTFSLRSQDESVRLPCSELARPPAARFQWPVVLQVTSGGMVILGGVETPMADVRSLLQRESDAIRLQGIEPARATVIVRADREVPTGMVQELIELAQGIGFEQFTLRAQETGRPGP